MMASLRVMGLGGALAAVLLGAVASAQAQAGADVNPAMSQAAESEGRGRIVLALPFDNRSGQPSLDWLREAAAEVLGRSFRAAGFAPMSRTDRLYALDHLGLPAGFQPSRASELKLAQTLDADAIVVGSFKTQGSQIVAEARVVNVPKLEMSAPVTAQGEMSELVPVFSSLAWKLTRSLDPTYSVAEGSFISVARDVRVDAFEQYIRGITEPDHDERIKHLKQSVTLSATFSPAWMALGREDYSAGQYDEAAAAFAKVARSDSDALEAGFYRGLSLMFSGRYKEAESAFGEVAKVLPLGEVLNNQAVAIARQGRDASAQFIAAETADPNAADYHFNLAISLKRRGEANGALAELQQVLKLRPNDAEAQGLVKQWADASADKSADKVDPLERIVRTFDAVAFRQAAVMMDQMEVQRLQSLKPHERAEKLAAQADSFLDRGLLLEAEREYLAAVMADSTVAAGHAGLAEVRERSGDTAAARSEAQKALDIQPSARAYVVLGRLDLGENHLDTAARDAASAVALEPGNKAAQELSSQIALRTGKKQ
ncbi:MAG: tetratricopeptide repeat protein [Terracidiphilus sp.]|nr:tetratricopeptide repeat protein [Terracidiphilus sp.]